MYNVVMRTIAPDNYRGVITWTSFPTEEEFNRWYDSKMQSWYEIVAKGVSEERALEICSSPESTLTAMTAELRNIEEALSQACALLETS